VFRKNNFSAWCALRTKWLRAIDKVDETEPVGVPVPPCGANMGVSVTVHIWT